MSESVPTSPADAKIRTEGVNVFYGEVQAIRDVSLEVPNREVMALMGPSGCGKSSFLRCLNRMNDVVGNARVDGRIELDGQDIYSEAVDPVQIRARVGMVAQAPNPFPKSVFDNVAFGPRLHGLYDRRDELEELVSDSLRRAGLWEEVKDHLDQAGTTLSGGQQQRLCVARAIANRPDVLLLDEPVSSLDPKSASVVGRAADCWRGRACFADARRPSLAWMRGEPQLEATDHWEQPALSMAIRPHCFPVAALSHRGGLVGGAEAARGAAPIAPTTP
jgi:phosphate transport system ATP-binding protein